MKSWVYLQKWFIGCPVRESSPTGTMVLVYGISYFVDSPNPSSFSLRKETTGHEDVDAANQIRSALSTLYLPLDAVTT